MSRKLTYEFVKSEIEKRGYKLLSNEYDGELHYKKARWSQSEETLSGTQKRDKIKSDFCLNKNIPLIRIPYWEFENIETILQTEFKKLEVL